MKPDNAIPPQADSVNSNIAIPDDDPEQSDTNTPLVDYHNSDIDSNPMVDSLESDIATPLPLFDDNNSKSFLAVSKE